MVLTHHPIYPLKPVSTLLLMSLCAGLLTAQDAIPKDVKALLDKHLCSTCHAVDEQPNVRLIGPTYKQLAARGHTIKETMQLIYEPQPSNWPDYPPMAPMPHLPKNEVKKIAKWIVSLREEE